MQRLAYSLRLGLSLAVCLRCVFALTRQAERDAAVLEEFQQFTPGRRPGYLRHWWKRQILMLGQYWQLLKSLPELAGSGSERFRAHFTHLYEKVRETSSQSERGPDSFLNSDEARRFQARFVSDLFTRMFSIKIDEAEAAALGYYALCSDALVDFMDFCQATGQVHSREHLVAVLPNFTERVQLALRTRQRPQAGDWADELAEGGEREQGGVRTAWTRTALRNLRLVALRPGATLLRTYWRTRDFAAVFSKPSLPELLREELSQSLANFAWRLPRGVRTLLVLEIHLMSCTRLADCLASMNLVPPTVHGVATTGSRRRPEPAKSHFNSLQTNASAAAGSVG